MAKVPKVLLVAALLVLGVALWVWSPTEPPPPPAPPVERLAAESGRTVARADTLSLLDWGRRPTPMTLVDVPRDALPNGLALTMLPFMVDWGASRAKGPDARILVRNVSVGGNPTAGENLLATVRVPLAGIQGVEWCLTPTRTEDGRDLPMGHAQLRFLFDPAQAPVVLGEDGQPFGPIPPLDDLILSWEAWRPPQTQYDARAGLDPQTYALTARAYSGTTRWLGDALRGNPWICWPLKLPETPDAAASVLLTGLLAGDAMARRTLNAMVKDGSIRIPDPAELGRFTQDDAARIRAAFSTEALPEDPLTDLMGKADLSYQLLERSCITQSLGVIQLALIRLHKEHGLGPAPHMNIVPDDLPPWVEDLATADTGKLLGYLPGAVLYAIRHSQVIPGEAWRILGDAGLLVEQDGKPLSYYYFYRERTPYGPLRENLM